MRQGWPGIAPAQACNGQEDPDIRVACRRRTTNQLAQGPGKEMSTHTEFSIDSGVKASYADPNSPRQRGTNEEHPLVQSDRAKRMGLLQD